MGLFSRLGAILGFGSASVELAIASPNVCREGVVSGELHLIGGRVRQKVRAVTVDLYEFWVRGHGKNRTYYQRRHERLVLAEYVAVDRGSRRSYPFELRIPPNARCTRRREGWEVRAEAHIPWSVDPRASSPLRVVPHREVLAVQRCVRDLLGFQQVEWRGETDEVMYDFRAPQYVRHLLDGMRLFLQVVGDSVQCHVELNKQERGAADLLKAMVGADREKLVLYIPRSELLTHRGSPNPAGAYEHVKVLFEKLGAVVPPLPDVGDRRVGA